MRYNPSEQITQLLGSHDSRSEVTRRAKIRDMIHDFAFNRRLTMRTEHHGGNYVKEQLDNGYPEWESLNRAYKLMVTRKIND